VLFISESEFTQIINYPHKLKAARCDEIYNFLIKKITVLNGILCEIIKSLCLENKEEENWFYSGITYVMQKKQSYRDRNLDL
jgi:hypothetical protein